jgi:hypothetical protein
VVLRYGVGRVLELEGDPGTEGSVLAIAERADLDGEDGGRVDSSVPLDRALRKRTTSVRVTRSSEIGRTRGMTLLPGRWRGANLVRSNASPRMATSMCDGSLLRDDDASSWVEKTYSVGH